MTDTEYVDTQTNLLLLGSILAEMNLDEFLNRIRIAEAVGPMLDPTLYRTGSQRLSDIRQLAEAALELRRVYVESIAAERSQENEHATTTVRE